MLFQDVSFIRKSDATEILWQRDSCDSYADQANGRSGAARIQDGCVKKLDETTVRLQRATLRLLKMKHQNSTLL